MKIAVALNLSNLKPAEKLAKLQTAITQCTGNPAVPTPSPTLADCQAAHDAAAAKLAEVAAQEEVLKTLRLQRDQLVDAAMEKYAGLGSFVEHAAIQANDPAIVTGCGYDLASERTPAPPVGQVLNLVLTRGDVDGAVDAGWDRDKSARSYEVQICLDPVTPTGWTTNQIAPQSSCSIHGQTAGSKLWVRVRAIGASGPGLWSDPAMIVVA